MFIVKEYVSHEIVFRDINDVNHNLWRSGLNDDYSWGGERFRSLQSSSLSSQLSVALLSVDFATFLQAALANLRLGSLRWLKKVKDTLGWNICQLFSGSSSFLLPNPNAGYNRLHSIHKQEVLLFDFNPNSLPVSSCFPWFLYTQSSTSHCDVLYVIRHREN